MTTPSEDRWRNTEYKDAIDAAMQYVILELQDEVERTVQRNRELGLGPTQGMTKPVYKKARETIRALVEGEIDAEEYLATEIPL